MLKNVVYFICSGMLFLIGLLIYGIILNLNEASLVEKMRSKGFDSLSNVKLVIEKSKHQLLLYEDTVLVKSYKAVFGRSKTHRKFASSEFVTPSGVYKISKIYSKHKYHKMFLLDYPNENDAVEALRANFISRQEYNSYMSEIKIGNYPLKNNSLGSDIGIHGIGEYDVIFRNLPFIFNWTNGSIAINNQNADELYSVVKVGTKVFIRP